MTPAEPDLELVHLIVGILGALVLVLGVLIPVLVWLNRAKRSAKYRADERLADEYRPIERRLVLSVMANNRRPGCVIGLSLTLLFGLTMIGMALAAGWQDYDWWGRIATIAYSLIAFAVLVLMLINFIKNMGYRVYHGREVQLDDHELIVDRSLIDSQTPGDDMFHPHLKERYLHEKYYYRIPVADISAVTVSAMVHQPGFKARQYPFVFIQFHDFEAVYMIQTRFMGGDDEMRFLKHLESIGRVPLYVDERYAEHYDYLQSAAVVQLD